MAVRAAPSRPPAIQRFLAAATAAALFATSATQPAFAQARKKAPATPAAPASGATMLPSKLDMPNPERGWYVFGEDLSKTSEQRLRGIYTEGYRLVFTTINLWQYRMSPVPSDYLDTLNAKLAMYRSAGLKVLLRVVYNYEANSPDAPLAVVMLHLNQFKPLFAANADVIAYVQAGLVGAWGEWHSSTNELTQPVAKAAIRDALLAAVPPSHYVQFRYPADVIQWVSRPLGAADAFKDTPQARIASHNDCFMSNTSDVGTYSPDPAVDAVQRAYMKSATEFFPYGGETCKGFTPTRQTCADILKEGPAYHLTYLNRNFYTAFHDQWKAEGCFDEVSRQLGYRFQLDAVNHAPSAAPGGSVKVEVDLRNTGWSRIFSARKLEVSLRHSSTGNLIEAEADTDLRTLPPQATDATRLSVDVRLPANAAPGNYEVWVSIPDIYPKTMNDGRYAVRFANEDSGGRGQRWDGAAGRFSTGTVVVVR